MTQRLDENTIFQGGLKTFFAVWGVISAGLVCVLLVFFLYAHFFRAGKHHDIATADDVRFVFNWAQLGEENIKNVAHSYESARSMTGDHTDAYAIQAKTVPAGVLHDTRLWTRGDNLSETEGKGVAFVTLFTRQFPWFPDKQELMSGSIYVYCWSLVFHGKEATATKIIFVRPSTNTVFYASVKT